MTGNTIPGVQTAYTRTNKREGGHLTLETYCPVDRPGRVGVGVVGLSERTGRPHTDWRVTEATQTV